MKSIFLIINYNDYHTTEKLLNNIKNYNCIDHILVVDNYSTDDSFSMLNKISIDNLTVIKNKENKGYGAGINFGCKYAQSKFGDCYIIVSNPDVVIYSENDLKTLINTFDDETAIVAPIIKEHEGFNRGWKVPTPVDDILLNLVVIHKILRPKLLFYKDDIYKNNVVEVEAVSGCFFLINSNYLKKCGYFDENIFLYYEENVISKKIQQIKKKIKINTTVEVFHNHSVTIDKNINKINKYKELKKSQIYFQKYYNHANWIELFLLKLTNKINIVIYHLFY
ncbi:glycosyltransferase family 2 protein [bacterium]|nr:glycosyltransferase family 2 protein [bacterium]